MIRVLKQDIIVINSKKIAKELLDHRSSIYSDRPHLATKDPCVVIFVICISTLKSARLDMGGPSTLVGLIMVTDGAHRGEFYIKASKLKLLLFFFPFS